MGMLSEVKCARCDRRYSGLRSRCPYCGARRIGRGKYSGENDSSFGKMLVAILILVVLIAAVIVLLVSSGGDSELDPDVSESVSPPTSSMPDDGGNISVSDDPLSTPEPSEEPTETPEPVVVIDSITITYNGSKRTDITMMLNDPQLPLGVKIAPSDAEVSDQIEWSSSNTDVFDVVITSDTSGKNAKITAVGAGTATLTVRVGDVTEECIIRIRKP